jgi:hypothetical protein
MNRGRENRILAPGYTGMEPGDTSILGLTEKERRWETQFPRWPSIGRIPEEDRVTRNGKLRMQLKFGIKRDATS